MTKKLSDSQLKVCDYFNESAASVEKHGGLIMGENFTAAERRAVVSELRGVAKKYAERARKNQSIGS